MRILNLDVSFKGGAESTRTDESDEETMVKVADVLAKKHMKEDVRKHMKDGVVTMRPKLAGKKVP